VKDYWLGSAIKIWLGFGGGLLVGFSYKDLIRFWWRQHGYTDNHQPAAALTQKCYQKKAYTVNQLHLTVGITGIRWPWFNWKCYYYVSKFIVCLFDGAQSHFQHYFSHIVAVSFIGWRNRRKPLTCPKLLTNIISMCCTPRPDRDSISQHQWW
jgi:hypothetical protein